MLLNCCARTCPGRRDLRRIVWRCSRRALIELALVIGPRTAPGWNGASLGFSGDGRPATKFLFPFEITSIILLIAIVGAMVWREAFGDAVGAINNRS
jgi:hypothetical protein